MFQDLCKKKYNQRYSSNGYTLLEILIAMVFFAIIAVGISLPFSQSISLSAKDQNIINANNLASLYLRDTGLKWAHQIDFDAGQLPAVNSVYTNNGIYTVIPASQDITTNAGGNVIVKRISVEYRDSKGNRLANISSDLYRP